jgi:hypothetical protein
VGLFDRIKLLARLDAPQAEEPGRELGDLVEPGSVEVRGMPALGSTDGAAGLDQLKELRASGLIDADTFDLIETTMTKIDAGELELLRHGESAPATVLAPPAPIDEANTRLRMTLEVHPATGSPYEVDCALATAHPARKLKVGDFLQVKVDPVDPKHVAIDWTAFGN